MLFYSRSSYFIWCLQTNNAKKMATFTFPKNNISLSFHPLVLQTYIYVASIIFWQFEVRKLWKERKKKFPVWILLSLFGSETCIVLRDWTIIVIFAIVIVVDDIIGLWGSIEHVYFSPIHIKPSTRMYMTWSELSFYVGVFFFRALTLFFLSKCRNTRTGTWYLDVHEDFLKKRRKFSAGILGIIRFSTQFSNLIKLSLQLTLSWYLDKILILIWLTW